MKSNLAATSESHGFAAKPFLFDLPRVGLCLWRLKISLGVLFWGFATMSLPRRYLILVATLVLHIILYTFPSAREHASSLATKYNVHWVSSSQSAHQKPDFGANERESELAVLPHPNELSSNPLPGTSSSTLQQTAITESRIPLQEAGVVYAAGFTYFERLYVWNGTIYAVMNKERQKMVPELTNILSIGRDMGSENLDPTDAVSFRRSSINMSLIFISGNANYHSRRGYTHTRNACSSD